MVTDSTVYFACDTENKIKQYDRKTAAVSVLAGSGEDYQLKDGKGERASIRSPKGLVLKDGVLYTCDQHSCLRSIELDTSRPDRRVGSMIYALCVPAEEVNTVCGQPGKRLFANGKGEEVTFLIIELEGILISVLPQVGLDLPEGLSLDCDGNLLIADHTNHRIRRLSFKDGPGQCGVRQRTGPDVDGPAFECGLNCPYRVVCDYAGAQKIQSLRA